MEQEYSVIKRNGDVAAFDISKVKSAILKAFLAVEGDHAVDSDRIHDLTHTLSEDVISGFARPFSMGAPVHIEEIQDRVELALMRSGEYKVAKSYVLYRDEQVQKRHEEDVDDTGGSVESVIKVTHEDGTKVALDMPRLDMIIEEACDGLDSVSAELVKDDVSKQLFDGMSASGLNEIMLMTVRTLIEKEPNYSQVAARLLLDSLREEALTFVNDAPKQASQMDMIELYPEYFKHYIHKGIELKRLTPLLADYDLERLGKALKVQNDFNFTYLSMQTLYDRYFIHEGDIRFELPQAFYMRVAMGLAIEEDDKNARAIEFYNLLTSFDFMSSTPTLFNAGTLRPQLSSCYLTSVADDLGDIYDSIKDNALLSKYAGGLGNDWTNVRAMGAHIKGTNGESQGVIPFLKVVNDTAVAVNQGGKRKGAVCAYLETWHLDIEEFLDLRKNTGDDRRRTHDMNTCNWIPDLFMKRVIEEGEWTLFSPDSVPDLHDLVGDAFETAYTDYEAKAAAGEITLFKTVPAVELWRKMLTQLFQTGHPWITFKDPCNIRSPQQHVGTVHSSNLCTEITLNTSKDEIAVCNLGSVNLPQHIKADGSINEKKLRKTVTTAIRMLDNVININYYSVPQAKASNLRHRPIGMGVMGFHDALFKMKVAYQSDDAVTFADKSMELISYFAIEASSDLAVERGCYESYEGSLWSQGILPVDSIAMLQEYRGDDYLKMDRSATMDWDALRKKVVKQGMRNSNTMAIAPTATISNICGVSQSIEPIYQNMYVKSNLSGEFIEVNSYLVDALKDLDIWDEVMVSDLKYFDGKLEQIHRIPDELKARFATAFEMDTRWLIESASRRQKWIDQAQSLNLYLAEPSGKAMDSIYKLAWVRGLKTTYYLRSLGATAAEKTSDARETAPLSAKEEAAAMCEIINGDSCSACS